MEPPGRPARDARLRTDRPPRLVLRFAVVTALGLALAGALILGVIREIDQRQAVRAATDRAHFVAETFLRGAIDPADAAAPVSGRPPGRARPADPAPRSHRRGAARLDRRFREPDHVLDRSPAHRQDRRQSQRTLADVRSGAILSRVSSVPAADSRDSVKALVSSVPVALGRGTVAVVSIEQDFAPITAAARESLLPVAGVLELALILLFVLLLPALARASRKLREYVAEIHLPGASRLAHRPVEPRRVARPRRRSAVGASQGGRARRRAAHRPRPLQGGQRLSRA